MFPSGYRRSGLRQLRYGAIALLLLSGFVFHGTGPIYSTIRFAYLALVVGLLAVRMRQRGPGLGYAPRWGAPVGPSTALDGALGAPGWFPDPTEAGTQRYWDGSAWTLRRRFDGINWVEEAAPPSG